MLNVGDDFRRVTPICRVDRWIVEPLRPSVRGRRRARVRPGDLGFRIVPQREVDDITQRERVHARQKIGRERKAGVEGSESRGGAGGVHSLLGAGAVPATPATDGVPAHPALSRSTYDQYELSSRSGHG